VCQVRFHPTGRGTTGCAWGTVGYKQFFFRISFMENFNKYCIQNVLEHCQASQYNFSEPISHASAAYPSIRSLPFWIFFLAINTATVTLFPSEVSFVTKVQPTTRSRDLSRRPHHWNCPAKVDSLSRGLITQRKLKENRKQIKSKDESFPSFWIHAP
jgi:hypothetical protein